MSAKRVMKWVVVVPLTAVFLLAAAFGFGIRGADVEKLRAFAEAVKRWQVNPDFRRVTYEYVELGTAAMQAKMCGISAGNMIMGFRSLPGLPKYLRVSPTSAAHYLAFTKGELSAYLHLSGEQGVGDGIVIIENLAREPVVEDEKLREFLASFKLPTPVATDAGAIASARRLLEDVKPQRPLQVRAQPQPLLMIHVNAIAARIGAPTDPWEMDYQQQRTVLGALDDQVFRGDLELWRTKQVSDFLSGIWAQGYGQIYLDGIVWALRLRMIGRIIVGCAMLGAVLLYVRHRRAKIALSAPAQNEKAHG